MERQEKKVVFITGGSRGMGAAIARRLAQEGMDIVITHSGRNADKAGEVISEVERHGRRGMALAARNEKQEELLEALNKTIKEFGRIDAIVLNAGMYSQKPIAEHAPGEFDEMIAVNVRPVFIAAQFAATHMPNGGRIITIGSNLADRVPMPEVSLYSMSKSALIGLTKGAARDLGPRNITVNLVQPGPVDTDMNPADSDFAQNLISRMAIGRYGRPTEIAGLVSYLCGEESQFITGASITIDGGFNA